MKILDPLWAQMRSLGFVVDPTQVNFNGGYTRFSRDSSGPNGWLKLEIAKELNFARAQFGDWKSGERYEWDSLAAGETPPGQEEEIREFLAKQREESEKKKAEGYQAAKHRAKEIWNSLPSGNGSDSGANASPYLIQKLPNSRRPYGTRSSPEGNTFVPAYHFDPEGVSSELVGLQKIQKDGEKYFQPEMQIKGSFSTIIKEDPNSETSRVFFCEGIATAASIWEAFEGQELVVACFNAGNLKSVIAEWRRVYPALELIICGDEDILTKVRGQWKNPGREYALGAGADKVCFPSFRPEDMPSTDFNDLHVKMDPAQVKEQISHQVEINAPFPEPIGHRPKEKGGSAEQGAGAEAGNSPPDPEGMGSASGYPGNQAAGAGSAGDEGTSAASLPSMLPRRAGANGKPPIKPTQQQVARALGDEYGLNLIKQGKDVFKWMQTHWQLCDGRDHDIFFRQAAALAGFDFRAGEINAIVEIFLHGIPHVPEGVNLFEAKADRANFLNGTLHFMHQPKTPQEREADPEASTSWYWTEFKEHSRSDYCVNVIPLEYKPHAELPVNAEFEKALKGFWPDSDPEQALKIRLYKQILGAALMPVFPKLIFFLGQPKTGKSTALELVRYLLDPANVIDSDPANWSKEFYLAPMAGKLANIHTDISTKRPIEEAVIKRIIDRTRIMMNRKGKDHISAMVPALHLFGANDMPGSNGADSRVFDRRIIILKTDTIQQGSGGGGEFSGWLWGKGREGILKAALEGLEDLLKTGKYAEPGSSKEERGEWATAGDAMRQFVEDIRAGDVMIVGKTMALVVDENAKISSRDLHLSYLEWEKRAGMIPAGKGKFDFGRRFGKLRVAKSVPINGVQQWVGVGIVEKDAQF